MTLDLTNLQPGDTLHFSDGTSRPFQLYDPDPETEMPILAGYWVTIDGRVLGHSSGKCTVTSVTRKSQPANPLIWGASIPGTEPVAVKDEYVPLTHEERMSFVCKYYIFPDNGPHSLADAAHRAGWERRRTP